jgi:hypothetical protein
VNASARSKPKGYGACPTFFLARCRESREGGSRGYLDAGYTIAGALPGLGPDDIEEDRWSGEIDRLNGLIDERDDVAILDWFGRFLPRCLALIPRRRRRNFLEGLYRHSEDNGRIEC